MLSLGSFSLRGRRKKEGEGEGEKREGEKGRERLLKDQVFFLN